MEGWEEAVGRRDRAGMMQEEGGGQAALGSDTFVGVKEEGRMFI
ncbi:uncharacterized, partial [Tachysurus ichikawai]